MKVNITVDPDEIALAIADTTTYIEAEEDGDYRIDGYLEQVIDAVLRNIEFDFDRPDAQLGEVIRFPVVIK